MNLHLCLDEKVIPRTIKYFEEALPNQNIFIILLEKEGQECTHVKTDAPYVYYEHYDTDHFWEAVGDIMQYSHIIYHFFSNDMARFTLRIPDNSPITWIVWGADLYNNLLEFRGYRLYAYPSRNKPKSIIKLLKYTLLYPYTKYMKKTNYAIRIKAIRRIKSVCSCDGDLQLLYKFYPEITPYKRLNFFYYPIDDIIGGPLKELRSNGDNIIVGNSASLTNNHRFVFEILKEIDLGERKVIVPLSYGSGKEEALHAGKMLKSHFRPITIFLPLNEYCKLLSSARTFIFGNFRQEAIGNIVLAFYLGATVFLADENPYLKDLRSYGYIFFTISQLSKMINYMLTPQEKVHNRELVLKLNNRELMLSYIKESFGDNE